MNISIAKDRLNSVLKQRNAFMVFSAALILVVILQSFALLFKEDRVVITPPELHQGFWIERGQASRSYLEEMALLFTNLLLDNSAKSAPYNRDVLLRYVTPENYGALKAELVEEERKLKKENYTTSFHAAEVEIDQKNNVAYIKGDLMTYVGQKRISQSRSTYELRMVLKKGRLYIKSFKELGQEDE